MKVRFLEPAQDQFRDAAIHYGQISKSLALAFIDAVDQAVQMVSAQPKIGPEYRKGTRRVLVKRFPIALFYRIETHEVLILVVWHTSRDPKTLTEMIESLD